MPNIVRLAAQSELPPEGEAKEFPLGDKVICVANVNGTISAMDNVCLHRGGPLGQGVIEGDKVVCPWHGLQWDRKPGQAGHNPGKSSVSLKVEAGDVMIEIGATARECSGAPGDARGHTFATIHRYFKNFPV
jgi:nitrite reductase (NADH) small subunit